MNREIAQRYIGPLAHKTTKHLNKFVAVWGIIFLLFSVIMYSLLTELEFQTFREDIPPWKMLAIVIAFAGGITTIGGALLPQRT